MARAYGGAGRSATANVLWSALSPSLRRTARDLAGRDAPAWLRPHVARARRPAPADFARLPTRMATAIWRALTAPNLAFALEKLDAEASRLEIEPRHPYLDRRVVECVLAIPPDVFIDHGYRKQFIQRALGAELPLRTAEGRAEHVPSPDPAVALRHEALMIERDLFGPGALVFEYVDRACAERMRDDYLAGRGRHGARLWSFQLLDTWLRRTFAS
jgi:asparagine synthetase B (glutamine-hydrolysing)